MLTRNDETVLRDSYHCQEMKDVDEEKKRWTAGAAN